MPLLKDGNSEKCNAAYLLLQETQREICWKTAENLTDEWNEKRSEQIKQPSLSFKIGTSVRAGGLFHKGPYDDQEE